MTLRFYSRVIFFCINLCERLKISTCLSCIVLLMYTIVTHSGSFDPDDVLAVAAVQLYLGVGVVKIVRSRDENIIAAADWVIDVGGKYDVAKHRFDHHQNGVPERANGVPYSAFGLIWKEYGKLICDSQVVANDIEKNLVLAIDAADNHMMVTQSINQEVSPFEFFDVIDVLKPVRGTDETYDSEFVKAVDWARGLLKRLIAHGKANIVLQELIKKQYEAAEDKRLVIFDEPMPRYALAGFDDVQVMVAPTPANDVTNWIATVVPIDSRKFQNRVLFPLDWAGLENDELVNVSGIEEAIFCHKERYIFVGKTRAAAIAAAERII